MALFLFLISLFGIMSALRMLRKFRERALISSSLVTKTGTIACIAIILVAFSLNERFISVFVGTISVLALTFHTLWLLERRQIDALKKETPLFLDRWILNMRIGHSLSSARDAALSDSSDHARTLLRPLFESSGSAPRAHLFLSKKVLLEMRALAESPHSALQRLQNMREMLRQADEFRRKSGQARRQTTIQSLVLLVLHLALTVFTLHRYGWQRHFDLILLSCGCAVCGLGLMRLMARKTKWTI